MQLMFWQRHPQNGQPYCYQTFPTCVAVVSVNNKYRSLNGKGNGMDMDCAEKIVDTGSGIRKGGGCNVDQ